MSARSHVATQVPSRRPTRVSMNALRSWVVACAVAESVGMTAAATAAKISQEWLGDPPVGTDRAVSLLLVVGGGLIEGIALGSLQASVLGRAVAGFHARTWLWVTVVVAGLGWAAASAPSVMSGSGDGAGPPLAIVLGGAVGLGLVMGAVLGLAQSVAFGASVRHPRRWIGISAAGWAPAMAIIFSGAMAPGSTWPLMGVVATAAVTGLCAGSLLGIVTGQLMPRLGIARWGRAARSRGEQSDSDGMT